MLLLPSVVDVVLVSTVPLPSTDAAPSMLRFDDGGTFELRLRRCRDVRDLDRGRDDRLEQTDAAESGTDRLRRDWRFPPSPPSVGRVRGAAASCNDVCRDERLDASLFCGRRRTLLTDDRTDFASSSPPELRRPCLAGE
eukprot:CAMPEP_0119547266 /NCGR_PEP_ID=MMETSP1352-20130426/1422_1 /TAXON_ID=265584 /ORGANISM="Stauroneis constricta, Strain CCMP1120" /LENGTH=138 /DNA_ID=CAMNT_0007592129 /DNA_START=111 /DNA_END=527 /DNA_ORIENTATION=-